MSALRRLQFVKSYLDRHGKPRFYFRRRGHKSVALPTPIGSEEWNAAYAKALAGMPAAVSGKRTTAGSINAMIAGYFSSAAFAKLGEVSKKQYRKRLEWIRRDYGEQSIAGLKRSHIVKMLDRMRDTPSAAQDYLRALRLLIKHALDLDLIETDPSLGIKIEMPKSDGYATWSDDEVATFRAFYPVGSKARLAMELLFATAVRVSDAVKVGPGHIRDGEFSIKTKKTGMLVTIEVMPELAAALAAVATIGIGTFLVNERGAAFTAEQFTKWFSQQAEQAGLKGCTAHGLRKAACVRLAEAGCTAPQIMAVSGHTSLKSVQRYIEMANRKKLAAAAVNKLRTMPRV